MTAQIGDIYKYEDQSYKIVDSSSHIPFNPLSFGLEPHMSSTACWRGFWCEYAIENKKLLLKELYLYNPENKYPPLNGVEVSPQEYKECECHTLFGGKTERETIPAHFGHRLYKDVNLLIPYTGKILLGKGFIPDYYIHMGFQKSWAYEELRELVFENGILLQSDDLSHVAKAQREIIDAHGEPALYPWIISHDFIKSSLPPEYAEKIWWME